jgi:hypothetical protein
MDDCSGGSDLEHDEGRLPYDEEVIETSATVQDMSHAPTTKYNYNRKQILMKEWIKQYAPASYNAEADTIKLELLTTTNVMDFFSQIMYKRYKESNEILSSKKINSYSHVSGFWSALKSQYKKQYIPLPPALDMKISDFLRGYKRLVANKKQLGQMKLFEGMMR